MREAGRVALGRDVAAAVGRRGRDEAERRRRQPRRSSSCRLRPVLAGRPGARLAEQLAQLVLVGDLVPGASSPLDHDPSDESPRPRCRVGTLCPRDRVPTPAQRQGPRPLRDAGRAAAHGGERPHLGVRRHPAHADPGQGPRSSPSCRCGGSTGWPTWCPTTSCRPTCPPEYAGRALLCRRLEMYPVECVARGYLTGSGLADYLATGDGLRRAAAGGPGRRLRAARADVHPGHQGGHRRPRRERHLRRGGRHRRRRTSPTSCAAPPSRSTAGPATSPASAASSSPTPSSSWAATPTAGWCWPTRC